MSRPWTSYESDPYRHTARVLVQEGDNAFRELEYQALAQAKGAAGLELSLEAMHQVFGHEGDVILTRRAAAHEHAVHSLALQATSTDLANVFRSGLHTTSWELMIAVWT